MKRPIALIPERTRKISGGFSFIQHRFLLDGFLESLTMAELSLYVVSADFLLPLDSQTVV